MGHRGTIIRPVRFDVAGGNEQRADFIRRGLVGELANDFTQTATEAFDRSGGDMLLWLGVETHRDAAMPPATGSGS